MIKEYALQTNKQRRQSQPTAMQVLLYLLKNNFLIHFYFIIFLSFFWLCFYNIIILRYSFHITFYMFYSFISCAYFHFLFDYNFSRLAVHGRNRIDVLIKSYWRLLIDEILNPFYVFEIFCIIFWCYDSYVFYSMCIVVISAYSIINTLIQTRQVGWPLSFVGLCVKFWILV